MKEQIYDIFFIFALPNRKNTPFRGLISARGGIGRHATLRGWCRLRRAGSNPVVRTLIFDSIFLFLDSIFLLL